MLCSIYPQRYYWRKRASVYWNYDDEEEEEETTEETAEAKEKETSNKKRDELPSRFPIAVQNLVAETLSAIRPKLKLFKSLEEAEEAADRVDKEMLRSIQV